MKIAVIGHSLLAIEQAFIFQNLGASVTLFAQERPLQQLRNMSGLFPQMINIQAYQEMVSLEVLEVLGLDPKKVPASLGECWEELYGPLLVRVDENAKICSARVKRIHKRFLGKTEEILGHSRLYDLFRVVFAYDPSDSLKKQIASNHQLFKDLPKEVKESLTSESESFEDFDAVIEVMGEGFAMGPAGSLALNEQLVSKSPRVYRGAVDGESIQKLKASKKVIFVGSNELTASNILALKERLLDFSLHVTIISDEREAFGQLEKSERYSSLYKELFQLFDQLENKWNISCDLYQKQLQGWRSLEPFERAKVPEPSEPPLPINMYLGHNVTAVDSLIDKEELFVTIEKPTFRDNELEHETLKTLSADAIVVCAKESFQTVSRGMRIEGDDCIQNQEPGMYFLKSKNDVAMIRDNLLSFFSRG